MLTPCQTATVAAVAFSATFVWAAVLLTWWRCWDYTATVVLSALVLAKLFAAAVGAALVGWLGLGCWQ